MKRAEKAVYLPGLDGLQNLKKESIQIIAPPIFALLKPQDDKLIQSGYAKNAKQAGLSVIAWDPERSGVLASGSLGWNHHQTVAPLICREGDMPQVLEFLAKDVGVVGVLSD